MGLRLGRGRSLRHQPRLHNDTAGNVHKVSGAVGAICRHSNVRLAIPSLEEEGRYLKISSTVCPPVVKKLSDQLLLRDPIKLSSPTDLLPPISLQDGFVPLSSPSLFPPIMTFGNGC